MNKPTTFHDPVDAFIAAACVPLDWHAAGDLEQANALLAAHPDIATANIHTAAILGLTNTVQALLHADAGNATAKGGPYAWDALTHLCFSRYLRLDPARSDNFIQTAAALLQAGANANTGWYEHQHQPAPIWESALYGAAGIAHHEALTRLLLAHGADPNDDETPYHTPESYDNGAMQALIDSGKLTADSLVMMLIRKADWHDYDGLDLLLQAGADPNRISRWGVTGLHQALRRDNALENIQLLLDHGANATLRTQTDGLSAVAIAARRGRGDVLSLFRERGINITLPGLDGLLAACALNDAAQARSLAVSEPDARRQLLALGGELLAIFSGNGNTAGVQLLLDLGVPVTAPFRTGDGYFNTPPNSTALHVAAWRARPQTVQLLIARGAPVNVQDGAGNTPLALAVKACVSSYWTDRRSPDSVQALLQAGADARHAPFPSGYAEVDALLRQYRHGD